jgi:hypothetical protein
MWTLSHSFPVTYKQFGGHSQDVRQGGKPFVFSRYGGYFVDRRESNAGSTENGFRVLETLSPIC